MSHAATWMNLLCIFLCVKKPDPKGDVLYASIYRTLEKAKLVQKTDQRLGMGKGVNYEVVTPRNF